MGRCRGRMGRCRGRMGRCPGHEGPASCDDHLDDPSFRTKRVSSRARLSPCVARALTARRLPISPEHFTRALPSASGSALSKRSKCTPVDASGWPVRRPSYSPAPFNKDACDSLSAQRGRRRFSERINSNDASAISRPDSNIVWRANTVGQYWPGLDTPTLF
jgi:hypothetical protein